MNMKKMRRGLALAVAAATLPLSLALGATPASASVGTTVIGIATANLGNTGSGLNSAGSYGYYNSANENWCADFAKWVWAQDGVNVSGLDARAASFAQYNGGLSGTPHVGDAVVFNYNGTDWAQHVALVASINPDGTIGTIGGNQSGVVSRGVISASGYYGSQRVSGYVSPIGGRDSTPPPSVTVPLAAAMVGSTAHLFDLGGSGGLQINDGAYSASSWSGWNAVSGSGMKQIAAVPDGNGAHVFAVMSDGSVGGINGSWDSHTWSNWYSLGGGSVEQLAAVQIGSVAHVLAVTSDGTLHINDGDYAAGSWGGWNTLPGSGLKEIAAVPDGNGAHVFASTGDGKVHGINASWDSHTWSNWYDL